MKAIDPNENTGSGEPSTAHPTDPKALSGRWIVAGVIVLVILVILIVAR